MSLLLALSGGAVSFSSATTDGADVVAATVSVLVAASSATTDGSDVAAGQVSVRVGISSATTDGADVLAGSVGVVVGVSSATTDGADVLIAIVNPPAAGASAARGLFAGVLFLGKEFVGELFAGAAVAHTTSSVTWDTSQGKAGVNRTIKFIPWKEPEAANTAVFDIHNDDEEVLLVLAQAIGALYG